MKTAERTDLWRSSYAVNWSEEQTEWVAKVAGQPFLSWMDGDPVRALAGLRALLFEVIAEKSGGLGEDTSQLTQGFRDSAGDTVAAVYSEVAVLIDRLEAMRRDHQLTINSTDADPAVMHAVESLTSARESLAWVETMRDDQRGE